jgi:hypothetical protein
MAMKGTGCAGSFQNNKKQEAFLLYFELFGRLLSGYLK